MKRIQIGIVALRDGVPHDGVHHAGPKVYKTENIARAAVRNHRDVHGNKIEYEFVPAFIEVK